MNYTSGILVLICFGFDAFHGKKIANSEKICRQNLACSTSLVNSFICDTRSTFSVFNQIEQASLCLLIRSLGTFCPSCNQCKTKPHATIYIMFHQEQDSFYPTRIHKYAKRVERECFRNSIRGCAHNQSDILLSIIKFGNFYYTTVKYGSRIEKLKKLVQVVPGNNHRSFVDRIWSDSFRNSSLILKPKLNLFLQQYLYDFSRYIKLELSDYLRPDVQFHTSKLVVEENFPTWALITFIACIIVSVGCLFIGIIVNSGGCSNWLTPRKNTSVSIKMANQRWRAGFVGGMMRSDQSGGRSRGIGPMGMRLGKSQLPPAKPVYV